MYYFFPEHDVEEYPETFLLYSVISSVRGLHCSNKSGMPCLWWSTGHWRKLPHQWCISSCCWTSHKIPAKVLHRVDTCRLQLKRDWNRSEWWQLLPSTHTHTHTTILWPSWILSGIIQVSWHQKGKTMKGKTILDLLEQEIVSGSAISWAICKSTPWPRHITTPASHHSVFYRPDALPTTQPTASKHWRYFMLCGVCSHIEGAETKHSWPLIIECATMLLFEWLLLQVIE